MKKSGKRSALFVILLVILLVSMSSFVGAFVRINEIMYNPTTEQGGDANVEWVELYNNGTTTLNLADWTIDGSNFDDYNITAGEYLIVVDKVNGTNSFEEWWGNNDTVWNSTDGNYKVIDGTLSLDDNEDTFNITNGTYLHVVHYLDDWGGDDNGKTLIFYKGNWTESALENGTPGANNDQFAPDFNKWITPSTNYSFISGLVNATVNITDVTNVSSALVDFNGTNSTMQQNNDIWYFVLNTTKFPDGLYNLTAYFNDTNDFSNSDTLFNVTVDNTNPKIYNPTTTANSRNFVSPGFVFNASVNATDTNLLNVTCTLSGTTVGNFSVDGDIHKCNLTAPLTENDFEINITAIDKSGNTNTTTVNFTTKHSTTASLSPTDIIVSGLNQSDKIVQVNATLSNANIGAMYDAGVIIDSFSIDSSVPFARAAIPYQSCSPNINNSQSCNATFNITIKGGMPNSIYTINWDANWTNSNFTNVSIKGQNLRLPTSTVTINSNPQITTTKNISTTIAHGENNTLELSINSTGNDNLQNVEITFSGNTLSNSYISISPSTFTSIAAATNKTFNATITIPKHLSPGNYTGTIYVNASNAENKEILLTVEVPTDSSWTTSQTNVTVYKRTDDASLTTTIFINNTGNIGQKYSITSSGSFKSYIWNSSNPTSVYVEKNTTGSVNIYHIARRLSLTTFDLDLLITSQNTSAINKTYITLIRDDNNPNVNITNPLNNSYLAGVVEFNVSATDLNLSTIKFYVDDNLVFNDINLTKTFNWNTTSGSYPDDVYTLKAIAYDGAGNLNTSNINVTVNNTDDAPIFMINIPTINIIEDNDSTILNLSLYFKTIDGDSLKYNFTQPNNVTVHVNNATQIANFTPAGNFSGINYMIFTAIDSSLNITSSNLIIINVTNVNDAPTIPSLISPANGSSVFSATGKVTLNWTESVDPDNNSIMYYVIYGTSTGVNLTTNTRNTYLALDNLVNATTYYWKVYAADGTDNSLNSSMFQFTVTRDSGPVISSFTPTSLTPSVAENSTSEFNATASDPDGGLLNYTWYIDGAINKTDGNKLNYTPDFTDAGTHIVTVNVTDNNSNSVSNTWTVTVTNTNREPVMDAISNKEAAEDSTLAFNITASDPDGDTLAYTSNQTNITIIKFSNTVATVSWMPTNDYVENNTIEFTVKDSTKNDSKTIVITVNNTNDAPEIISVYPTENKTIAEGVGNQLFNITILDADVGDYVNATWFGNTTGTTSIIAPNSSNVTITGLDKGIYNIRVIVNDTSGAEARYEWKLTITTGMISDELTSPITRLNQSKRENVTDVMINHTTFGGIDFGNKTMNFSRVANLEDAVNISRGLISVDTETYPELNKNASIVMKGLNYTKAPWINMSSRFESIEDGNACPEDVCTNITYDIENGILRFNVPHFSTYYAQTNTSNGAPVITSTPATTATERVQYTYDVDATDPDGDTLTYSLVESKYPEGMSINSNTGLISWTPTLSQVGLNNVTVSVSDGKPINNQTNQSFNITVAEGPKLAITDLDVKVDGKTDKNLNNGDKIKGEAKPGSKVEFKLEIENLFTDEEDLEIEDIQVEITIEEIDDGDDLDDDADEFDLKPEKHEDVAIEFKIPLELDENIYNVIIDVEGRDENGTNHEINWQLELEVEKENHEIKIIRSSLTPSTIKCQRQISINTEIINTGADDEDDVTLEVTSFDLGINSLATNIELDEGTDDNRFTKLFTSSISNDVLPGTYPIIINTYYDGKLSETETVNLDVQECELVKKVKEKVKEKPKVEVIMPKVVAEKKPEAPVEVSFVETDTYKTLLAILIVLFIGTAIFIIGAGYIVLKK